MCILPSGAMRFDVRATRKTDVGAVLKAEDMSRFAAAPTFETSLLRYAWLNEVQAINPVVEVKRGDNGYVQYDVSIVR